MSNIDIDHSLSGHTNKASGCKAGGAGVGLGNFFKMIWRRRVLMLGVVLIGVLVAMAFTSMIPPRYTARSLLLIDEGQAQNISRNFQEIFSQGVQFDSSIILSEVEIIRSRMIGRRVVERLGLMSDPEFNPRFSNTNIQRHSSSGSAFKTLSIYGQELHQLPFEMVEQEVDAVVDRFLENLNVQPIMGSYAVEIEYSSLDPSKAALITNSLVDVYIDQRLEGKFLSSKKVTAWLDKRLGALRAKAMEAEQKIQDYKIEHGLMGASIAIPAVVSDVSLAGEDEISGLRARLVEAQVKEDQVRAVLEQASSTLLDNLKLQEATLEQKFAQLSNRYGAKHPQMIKLQAERAKLETMIKDEGAKVKAAAEERLHTAHGRVKALENILAQKTGQHLKIAEASEASEASEDEARSEVGSSSSDIDSGLMIGLRALERDAQSAQMAFDRFLRTYRSLDERDDLAGQLQEAGARVISYASVPQSQSYPDKEFLLGLSIIASLLLGVMIAVFLEKMDNSFRSANQLEGELGFPCYALIPELLNMKQTEMSDYIVENPSSVVAEAIRTLRIVLTLRQTEGLNAPKVIAVTSSFPGEGKTTLCVWLGRLAAKSGERVIVIDADLRRPNLHRALACENHMSLVEYLTSQNELRDVIEKDEATGMDMIYGRSVPNSALDLVSSRKMADLIEELKGRYDLIIIDTPSCMAASDARVLARYADQALYSVAWNRTPREVVASGVKQFADMGYKSLATVLTAVDVARHAKYGYGDTAYYYGRYKEYYRD